MPFDPNRYHEVLTEVLEGRSLVIERERMMFNVGGMCILVIYILTHFFLLRYRLLQIFFPSQKKKKGSLSNPHTNRYGCTSSES
jgi:hypothetical protein